ncbi:MAG: ATPase [Vicinamibacterales bacterium]
MLELLDRLEAHVAEGKRVLLSNRIMVEEGEFMAIVDQLRESIPVEIQQARRVIQERQKIIIDAQSEATRIITQAKERADYLVGQQGVTAEARYQGENHLRQVRDTAKRTMVEVDGYARKQLDQVERVIKKSLAEIESAKGSLPPVQ